MQNNIRNTNLRFNLDKEQQRKAWEYLQTMDRQDFKSYSQVISIALVDIRQTIPDWKDYIERLSGYMASNGKQYQNHAATIISWARQDHPASRQRNYESEEYETL